MLGTRARLVSLFLADAFNATRLRSCIINAAGLDYARGHLRSRARAASLVRLVCFALVVVAVDLLWLISSGRPLSFSPPRQQHAASAHRVLPNASGTVPPPTASPAYLRKAAWPTTAAPPQPPPHPPPPAPVPNAAPGKPLYKNLPEEANAASPVVWQLQDHTQCHVRTYHRYRRFPSLHRLSDPSTLNSIAAKGFEGATLTFTDLPAQYRRRLDKVISDQKVSAAARAQCASNAGRLLPLQQQQSVYGRLAVSAYGHPCEDRGALSPARPENGHQSTTRPQTTHNQSHRLIQDTQNHDFQLTHRRSAAPSTTKPAPPLPMAGPAPHPADSQLGDAAVRRSSRMPRRPPIRAAGRARHSGRARTVGQRDRQGTADLAAPVKPLALMLAQLTLDYLRDLLSPEA